MPVELLSDVERGKYGKTSRKKLRSLMKRLMNS
jgi:hypothetical protein